MRLLSDDRLYLRPVEPEDLELLYREENDSTIWWLGEQTGPYSRFMLRQYLADVTGDIYTDRQLRLVAVRKDDEVPVGLVDLSSFSPQHLRAEVGVLVFFPYRGQGLAMHMLGLLEDYAREHLRLHQLYAYTPSGNEQAVSLFRHSGYHVEHQLKDWLLLADGPADALLLQKIL